MSPTDATDARPTGAEGHQAPEASGELHNLTPRQIVEELDQYIIGQDRAKRAVAIALRNRWRRRNVESELQDEILPNNIIMIGPTGVGKTEIARRLAKLAGAPFLKVEASKFTEVGYVGRDVESMVRDLVDIAVNMIRSERQEEVREVAEEKVEDRLLDLLLPPVSEPEAASSDGDEGPRTFVVSSGGQAQEEAEEKGKTGASADRRARTREKLRGLLRDGELEDRTVEVEVTESTAPMLNFDAPGMEGVDWSVGEMLQEMMPKKTRRREVTVSEARRILLSEELDQMVDEDEVLDEALDRVENMGIVFLDEIDKVAAERGEQGIEIGEQDVGGAHELDVEAGVQHVGARHTLMDEARRVPGDQCADDRGEGAGRDLDAMTPARRQRTGQHVDAHVLAGAAGRHGAEHADPQHQRPQGGLDPADPGAEHVAQHDLQRGEHHHQQQADDGLEVQRHPQREQAEGDGDDARDGQKAPGVLRRRRVDELDVEVVRDVRRAGHRSASGSRARPRSRCRTAPSRPSR